MTVVSQRRSAPAVLDLPAEPLVELGADDRVAIRALLVEVLRAVVHARRGTIVEHPEALLDDVTLERRFVAEIGMIFSSVSE